MPAAKKPSARRTVRKAIPSAPSGPITRKEVEAAAAKFDRALTEANDARR